MIGYAARRIGAALIVLVLASMAIFCLLHVASGNPASILAGPDATRSEVSAISRQLGLDRSLPAQYWSWVTGNLTGHLGESYILKRPIGQLIAQRLGSTVELIIGTTIVIVILGGLLGIASASSRNRVVRAVVDAISTVALAAPPFVSSIVFIFIFAVEFRLVPSGGDANVLTSPSMGLKLLVLPAIAAALPGTAVIARLLATEMRRASEEEFVRTAVSKGSGHLRVVLRHVVPNALGPAIVELGIRIGELFAGAVVVESIFARNGIGSLLVTAVEDRDYLLAQDVLLLSVTFAIVMQFLTELTMSKIDPRLRVRGGR